jgi:hypothetical protein
MEDRRRNRWLIGLGIAGAGLVLCLVAGLVGWRALMRYFVCQYYEGEYQPIPLTAADVGHYPAEHHLDDVPWISTGEPLCQSNSLQMVAAQRGIERPRRHFDFLMGFTYGATQIPGGLAFYPGTDPETGFVAAAPYLGLVRRYYTTDDETLYLDALRTYLAQGYPVRLGLDMGLLHDLGEPIPHSDLLVGYDDGGFYYYETVCLPGVPCEPGHRPPGDEGLYVAEGKLLDAVQGQAEMLEYPWRYSLSIFEPAPLEQDLGPVWTRNGQSLAGGARYGPPQGADFINKLADEIEERGTSVDVEEIGPGLEVAAYVRSDNAAYLRDAFPGEADLERAAALFDQAAASYQAALDAVADGIADGGEAGQVAAWLRAAAAAEREVGEILMARGR